MMTGQEFRDAWDALLAELEREGHDPSCVLRCLNTPEKCDREHSCVCDAEDE